MMIINKYRIDRMRQMPEAPLGMASICYLGNDYDTAVSVFKGLEPGIDAWGQPNKEYGVGFSEWSEATKSYKTIVFKREVQQ